MYLNLFFTIVLHALSIQLIKKVLKRLLNPKKIVIGRIYLWVIFPLEVKSRESHRKKGYFIKQRVFCDEFFISSPYMIDKSCNIKQQIYAIYFLPALTNDCRTIQFVTKVKILKKKPCYKKYQCSTKVAMYVAVLGWTQLCVLQLWSITQWYTNMWAQ